MAVCLASLNSTTEEDSVSAGGAEGGKLIESESLAAVLGDASASTLREAESSDLDALGQAEDTLIIGNPANNNSNLLAQILTLGVANNLRNRDRSTVHAAHAEAVKDDLVELAASTAREEAIKLSSVREQKRRATQRVRKNTNAPSQAGADRHPGCQELSCGSS